MLSGRVVNSVKSPSLSSLLTGYGSNDLRSFDPRPMVKKAAGYLLREGPATRQERWEEAGGYSPSALPVMIAALICAASFARDDGKEEAAVFIEEYTDWIEHNLEQWTVTGKGTLVAGITDRPNCSFTAGRSSASRWR
jgi:glucoamylase